MDRIFIEELVVFAQIACMTGEQQIKQSSFWFGNGMGLIVKKPQKRMMCNTALNHAEVSHLF